MKTLMSAALLLAALHAGAQESKLVDREFWQAKPDVAIVKTEVSKGFDFKNMQGSADPVFLAINNDAPAAVIKYLLDQPGVDISRTIHEGRTYLHTAAFEGNAEAADVLLSKGADMYVLDANGHTALTYPAIHGKLTTGILDVFLKHGLDIRKKYDAKDGANLLLLAVSYDSDLSLTNYLTAKGLSIHDTDANGNTAFYYAAKIGDVPLMKTLLQKGVKYDDNALIAAAQGTYRTATKLDVYQYLVDELKLNPSITTKSGQNVLHYVTRKQNQADVVKFLADKGVDVNKTDDEGNTPFINAASGRSLEVVETLFPKVKNINAVNTKGESALLAAVRSSTGEVVSFLVNHGADVTIEDKEGNNLVFYLAQSYRVPGSGRGGRGSGGGFGGGAGGGFGGGARGGAGGGEAATGDQRPDDFSVKLKVLQEKGVDFSKPQPDGGTLYHLAASKNDLALFRKLDGLHIDVNAKDKEGATALHKAAVFSKDDTVLKYLLSIGAKKDIATDFGETAFDLVKENENLSKNNVSVDFLK